MAIVMVDLKRQYEKLKPEIDAAIARVLSSTQFIGGPEVENLAREVSQYLQGAQAIPCASGTDALILALMALGVGPGDEVITTPFTFVATVEAIVLVGATPVFVDIHPDTLTMDVAGLEAAITPRTRAIIPVHLYGQAAHMEPILAVARKYRLRVIEDAAQALGTEYRDKKVGTLGDVGCISFYPGKNLGAYGDAGMVVTTDEGLARKIRMLTDHGSEKKYLHRYIGMNSRLDALQAAILRVKLPYLDQWNRRRQEIAAFYRERLAGTPLRFQHTPEYTTHIYHQFVVRTDQRDALQSHLHREGIATAIHYPIPVHLQPAFRERFGFREGQFPQAEKAAREVLSLPMHPDLLPEEMEHIVQAVHQFFHS